MRQQAPAPRPRGVRTKRRYPSRAPDVEPTAAVERVRQQESGRLRHRLACRRLPQSLRPSSRARGPPARDRTVASSLALLCLCLLLGSPALLSGQEPSSAGSPGASNASRVSVPAGAVSDARLLDSFLPGLSEASAMRVPGFVRTLRSKRSSRTPRELEFTVSLLRIGQALLGDAGLVAFGGPASALPSARFGLVTSPGPGVEINADVP